MVKLKAYFWKPHQDDEYGIAIVAENSKRAKELGYAYWASGGGVESDTWIEQRVKWKKDANVKGLEKEDVLDHLEGLRRNIYSWIEDTPCEGCGSHQTLYYHNGKGLCGDCIEKSEGGESGDSSHR